MSILDDLYAERYGRATHSWWKTPEQTDDETDAAFLRRMLLKAAQHADETAVVDLGAKLNAAEGSAA